MTGLDLDAIEEILRVHQYRSYGLVCSCEGVPLTDAEWATGANSSQHHRRHVATIIRAARESESTIRGDVAALIDAYLPAIKQQLICSEGVDCGCTFCDFVGDLRTALSEPTA